MTRSSSPLVSAVIPTFNRAGMLREAVASVLGQDYDRIELIVVDDGSTDDTPAVLETFGSAVKALRRENRGVSAARNAGIKAASGDLIAFLDSDDLWLPEKISVQVDFFKRNKDAWICQTEEIWIRNGLRINPKKKHRKRSGLIFEPSLHLCLVSPSAVMIRKDLFDRVGMFDETLPACEDYDLWLRIGALYPVFLIDRPLIVKRGGHAGQLSAAPGLDAYRIRSLVRLLESGVLTPDQRCSVIPVLIEKCRIYSSGCLTRGRAREADRINRIAERYGNNSNTAQ